jgi:hypothetical protein
MRTQTCLFGLEVPSREEFWCYFDHSPSFSFFNYHFGKRVFKSTQVFHVYLSLQLKDSSVYLQILLLSPFILLLYMDSFHHRSKSKSYQDFLEYSESSLSFFEYQHISCLMPFRKRTIRDES